MYIYPDIQMELVSDVRAGHIINHPKAWGQKRTRNPRTNGVLVEGLWNGTTRLGNSLARNIRGKSTKLRIPEARVLAD
jgi:hypothetical protein